MQLQDNVELYGLEGLGVVGGGCEDDTIGPLNLGLRMRNPKSRGIYGEH